MTNEAGLRAAEHTESLGYSDVTNYYIRRLHHCNRSDAVCSAALSAARFILHHIFKCRFFQLGIKFI